MPSLDHARPLNLLIASATSDLPDFTRTVIQRLSLVENVRIRSIIRLRHDHALAVTTPTPNLTYYHDHEDYKSSDDIEREQEQAAELCSWADLLVLAPIDADSLARMLHGMTNNLHLEILRSWDVSKKILIVPGMSTLMWENPMTKKQLSKIRRKWNWIRVLQPVLWSFEPSTSSCNTSSGTSTSTSTNTNNNSTTSGRKQLPWDGQEGLLESVQTQVDLLTIGRGLDLTMPHPSTTTTTTTPASALAS
ncbi:flavo protein, partial [Glonium stellatum]